MMPEHKVVHRWRYPAVLIFLLGGFLGLGVNLGTVWIGLFIFTSNAWSPFISFFLGTFLNQAFHFVYYRVVYVNQEIRMRTSLPVHLAMSLCVSAGSSMLLWFLMRTLQWPFLVSLISCLFLLALSNALLNRISTFSSARMAQVEYREMDEDYYDGMTDEARVSRFRAWYHRSRYERLNSHVGAYYKKGMKMADLGCGNCFWNTQHLPVFGVDINSKMLQFAKRQGRLEDYKVCADLSMTGLKPQSLDLVLMSEVLEHLFNLEAVLAEVNRVLKKEGTFLITVPYDYFLGPFFILFNLNCLYMGYLRGSRYHRYRCGHIHHFTRRRLGEALQKAGFELKSIGVVNGLLLYAAAQKVNH